MARSSEKTPRNREPTMRQHGSSRLPPIPRLTRLRIEKFQAMIWEQYRLQGRSFPWRSTRNPYRILVSEIMLQQTQTSRVLTKYREFLAAFPTLSKLAAAPTSSVLAVWSGLGYNRRALNIHALAERVLADSRGRIPRSISELEALPGIGHYSARAIACFAFGAPSAFIETNIRSVFIDYFFPPSRFSAPVSDESILPLIESTLDHTNPREWYYALMDYGVMVKATRPGINSRSAHAVRQTPFRGSRRELRGKIVRELTRGTGPLTLKTLAARIDARTDDVAALIFKLQQEGFPTHRLKGFTTANR